MSDDDSINTTPLDQGVDSNIKTPQVRTESFSKNFQGDTVAISHTPVDGGKDMNKSWTMSEIERVVSTEVLPVSRQKLAVFGVGLSRKNDFRLKELTRRLDDQVSSSFKHEINEGPISKRLRAFDIQSQSMRMIAANAALGTYQFQKNQVLPYMRKTLALNYEKANLLKRVVGGITSLEHALVGKLEAIKMNTAGSIPHKVSLYSRIKTAVRDKQIDRVATNVANLVMEGYDAKYRKYVSPVLAKLHRDMQVSGPKGGVNKAVGGITRKINSLRHIVKQKASEDPSTLTTIGRIQQRAAQLAGGVMNTGVRVGQRIKLSAGINDLATKAVSNTTSFLSNLQPFAVPGSVTPTKGGTAGEVVNHAAGVADLVVESSVTKLLHLTQEIRKENNTHQSLLLDHITAIRQRVAPKKVKTPKLAAPVAPAKKIKIPKVKALAAPRVHIPDAPIGGLKSLRTKAAAAVARLPKVPHLPKMTVPKMTMPKIHLPKVDLHAAKTAVMSKIKTAPKAQREDHLHPSHSLLRSLTTQMGASLKQFHQSTKQEHHAIDLYQKAKAKRDKILDPSGKRRVPGDHTPPHVEKPVVHRPSAAKRMMGLVPHKTIAKVKGAPSAVKAFFVKNKPVIHAPSLPKIKLPRIKSVAVKKIRLDRVKPPKLKTLNTHIVHTVQELAAGRLKRHEIADAVKAKRMAIVEKMQEKRKVAAALIASRLIHRKGSYEEQHHDVIDPTTTTQQSEKAAAKLAADPKPNNADAWQMPSLIGLAAGAAGFVGKNALKYGWKGAKYLAKGGFEGTKAVAPVAAKGGLGIGKGLLRFAGREAGMAGRLAGRGGLGLLKMGGRSVGALGKGIGRRIPLLGLGIEALDYLSGERKLNWRNMAKSGLSLGGGALGGLLGGVATAGLGGEFFGGAAGYAGGSKLGDLIFGDDKKTNMSSNRPKQRGIADGDQVKQTSIFEKIQNGFTKAFFGDKYHNGEYKEGTSLVAIMKDKIGKTLSSFGKEIMALPGQIKAGLGSMATKAGNAAKAVGGKIASAATATVAFASKKAQQTKDITIAAGKGVANAYNNFSLKKLGSYAAQAVSVAGDVAQYATPTGFIVGASNAIFGWGQSSGNLDNPALPYYAFVTQVLNAYGIKNRTLYNYIHSLEISQDKINNNQTKPFDDSDMAYMASRFGFDSKNKDAVNYFKLWYKRRFLPAMTIIAKVLKSHKMTFDSVLAASEKDMAAFNIDLKKELASSNIASVGLEPTSQAYNKFAKIGNKAPEGVAAGTLTQSKPFDPRDPKNRAQGAQNNPNNPNSPNNSGPGAANDNSRGSRNVFGDNTPEKAARTKAAMAKGGIVDQPEYKAAYQKLPPNLKKLVDKSKSLQFVLWSTSVQHGADNAVKMFQKDYTEGLSEKSYIKSIYDDRSSKFSDLSSQDRTDAMMHLGDEEKFAEGIGNGTSKMDRGTISGLMNNIVNPNSVSSGGGLGDGDIKPAKVTGSYSERVKDAVKYLMSKGYKNFAAAGIVGNLMMESKLNTSAKGDSGAAFGIAQWHKDRRDLISNHFKRRVEGMDLHGQLDAVDWEIQSGKGTTGRGSLREALNSAPDVGTASRLIMQRYERPADHASGGPNDRARASLAMTAFKTVGTDGANPPKPAVGAASTALSSMPTTAHPGPAAKKQPAKAAPAPANTKSMDNHASSLDAHTQALNAHVAAMIKGNPAVPAPANNNHNTVVAPTTVHQAPSNDGFIVMNMKKAVSSIGDW